MAWLAARQARRSYHRFLAAYKHPRQAQQDLLARLLGEHAETDFGRDHGLGRLQGREAFRRAVPIRTYEQLRPYMRQVLQGQTNALFPPGQEPMMFSLSSGTTSEPKHIPVTPAFLQDIRQGWNAFGLAALNDHPSAWLRPIAQISSSMHEATSPAGVPCGAISGLLAATQKRIVRRMYVVPTAVAEIADAEARYYTALRCAAAGDVAIITTANPSSTLKMIDAGSRHADRLVHDLKHGTLSAPGQVPPEISRRLKVGRAPAAAKRLAEGLARDGQFRPGHLWNVSVLLNWTGGTLGLYLPKLKALFDDAPVRDVGLLASEGRFSIPLTDNTPAGVAEIISNVLEFIPAEQRGQENPDVLWAEELQQGQEYILVVTNRAGLWRYNLDDRVRVTGFHDRTPVFEFLSRGGRTASMTGEKLTEHQAVAAMDRAAAETGATVQRFTLQPVFCEPPYYRLRLEGLDRGTGPVAEAFDRHLGEVNIEYASKRSSGRLGPVVAEAVASEVFDQAERDAIAARRGRSEQYKHQYLLTDVLEASPSPDE